MGWAEEAGTEKNKLKTSSSRGTARAPPCAFCEIDNTGLGGQKTSRDFCVFFFYRPATGRPTRALLPLECHRNATHQSDSFCFKRDAFYQSLKSKVRLAAAKAALTLRINSMSRAVS